MKRVPAVVLAITLAAAPGCQDIPFSPDVPPTEVAEAPGGVPGPPPGTIPDGAGPPPDVPAPPDAGPPSFLQNVVATGAGGAYSCALLADGAAFCWGANEIGQLGDGSTTTSAVPVQVSGGQSFERLVVGNANACGLTAAGSAHCWGSNHGGMLGAGVADAFRSTPVAVAGGLAFVDLSIGLANMCGVATDGSTYCWGANDEGLMDATVVGGPSNVPAQVTGSDALGLESVSLGFLHVCGLDGLETPYCWGQEVQFGNGSDDPTVIVDAPVAAAGGATLATLEAGNLYTCGLDTGGAALCWGMSNTWGEQGRGSTSLFPTDPAPVAGGLTFSSLDVNDNNTIVPHTCGVTTSGEAWCWGSNDLGQLGASSAETCTNPAFPDSIDCATSPVAVSGGLTFESVDVGIRHTCAVAADGRVYCWGDNASGELGDGTMDPSSTPVAVRAPATG